MSAYRLLLGGALLLTFIVVTLGAYVRLSDAGLGCPDWPGCYGRIAVPSDAQGVHERYAQRPLDTGKAWREMVHRYAAGLLGLAIAVIFIAVWRKRRSERPIAAALVAVVIVQALLGMWTVTLLLKPIVVTAHLAGGFTTLALLWWLWLRSAVRRGAAAPGARAARGGLRLLAAAGLVVLGIQALLGGWTSANYAAVACVGFPTCNGAWLPEMDFAEAFVPWRGLGIDYEFGVLDHPARVAIQFTHRVGALVTAALLVWLAVASLRTGAARLRRCALLLLALLVAQILLGIANVVFYLPLPVAVAHEGTAALLLLTLVSINCRLAQQGAQPHTMHRTRR